MTTIRLVQRDSSSPAGAAEPKSLTKEARTASSPSARAERTRERIRLAAGHCFAERGYARTTMHDVAHRAQVSKASVYVHFAGKEELLNEVLEATLAEWRETIWTRAERESRDSCEAIAILLRASIDYARSHPVLRTILVRDERLLVDEALLRRTLSGWRDRLIALLERGTVKGELRHDLNAGRTADAIRLWHLAFLDRLYDESLLDVGDPELLEESVGILVRGLKAPS